jgi:hypothetical protein
MEKTSEQTYEYVNHGTDDQMLISGYKNSILKTTLIWILIVFTIGFLRLIFYWKPEWMLICTHTKCDLKLATKVLLKDKYSQFFVEDICILHTYKQEYVSLFNFVFIFIKTNFIIL